VARVAKKRVAKRRTTSDRYVLPNAKDGGWDIVKEGHRRATGHARTKNAAVRDARAIVRKEGGGEVRILNRNGKIVDSDTIRSTPVSRRK
jgi:hypothetical protein